MYRLLRTLLFLIDAETVHHLVMRLFALTLRYSWLRRRVARYFTIKDTTLRQHIWGIDFENPVGLAAGFDKNASYINALGALGFGFLEIGTVTGQGQMGNLRPRMFRLTQDRGLLNRMGFNNEGSQKIAERLESTTIEPLIGVNIGKTKTVALEDAPADYELSFRRLYPFARYIVVNVSSPNTPNLRALQERAPLLELMNRLRALNQELAKAQNAIPKPLLLKIAPDISDALLDDILSVLDEAKVDGIIATNTTIKRHALQTPGQEELGAGGISGAPVRARSIELIQAIYKRTQGQLPIIGVGGICSPEDALETIEAGASLIQVWTGFVYEGPCLVRRINAHLAKTCAKRQVSSIRDLVGRGHAHIS